MYIDKVDAIVDFALLPGLITSQFAQEHKIIHFNACASDRNVAKGEYNFLHTTLPDMEAKMLVNDVVSKYRNVALVVLNDASGNATSLGLRKEMQKAGINFTEYLVNPNKLDMRNLIGKIEQSNPDKIVKGKIMDANKGISDYEVCLGNPYDIVFILIKAFEANETKEEALKSLNNLRSIDGVFGEVVVDNDGVINTPPIKKVLKIPSQWWLWSEAFNYIKSKSILSLLSSIQFS